MGLYTNFSGYVFDISSTDFGKVCIYTRFWSVETWLVLTRVEPGLVCSVYTGLKLAFIAITLHKRSMIMNKLNLHLHLHIFPRNIPKGRNVGRNLLDICGFKEIHNRM